MFPEGTTTRGDRLLPFHSNLLAPALEVGCPVWPVGLRYTQRGRFSDAAAFVGDMGFVTSLANVLVADDLEIEVTFLPALDAAAYENRHTLARAAHAALSEHFGLVEVPERAEAPDNGAELVATRSLRLRAVDLEQSAVVESQRAELAAPDAAGIEADDVRAAHQPLGRPVAEDDRRFARRAIRDGRTRASFPWAPWQRCP